LIDDNLGGQVENGNSKRVQTLQGKQQTTATKKEAPFRWGFEIKQNKKRGLKFL